MKILIIKTSSLGDIIHTLPALTDAAHAIPNIEFDWVAEAGFAEIPAWHNRVNRVIPLEWRRWRKNFPQAWRDGEFKRFYTDLRKNHYDKIIDAQGLLKSAIITRMSKGERCGLDFSSARETLAAAFYQRRYSVLFEQHAVVRARQLFALALGYPIPDSTPDYAIAEHFSKQTVSLEWLSAKKITSPERPAILFIHGTTRDDKEWPEQHWQALAQQCVQAGYNVLLPWGNAREQQRALRIADVSAHVYVLPKLNLNDLAQTLLAVKCAVAVDTGIGHLAAALNVPTVSLYGPTDPEMIGACGRSQIHLRAPLINNSHAMRDISPAMVLKNLSQFQL